MEGLIFEKENKRLHWGLLVLRLAAGSFMLSHGYSKLMKAFGETPISFADPIGLGETTSWALVVFAEFFCSLFIILGIYTRLASIPLIITMMVAAFIRHHGDPFGKKELALLYMVIYIFLLLNGSGKYALGRFLHKEKNL